MKNDKEATLKKWGELLDKMGLSGTSTTKINIAEMMESEASKLLKEEMEKNNIISDWLDKYGDPEIDKKVGMKLEEMNKERYNQIIDEVYENYENAYYKGHAFGYKKLNDNEFSPDLKISKEDFINICKTNPEFSEKWGLKIEERELSLEDRIQFYYKRDCSNGKSIPDKILKEELKSERTVKMLDKLNIPTRLITLTYNNETIESYERK